MSTMMDKDEYVTASMVELGLPALLEANRGLTYEVNLDTHPLARTIRMDGIDLQGHYRYLIPETTDLSNNPLTITMGTFAVAGGAFQNLMDIIFINDETFFELGLPGNTHHLTAPSANSIMPFESVYTFAATMKIKAKYFVENQAGSTGNIRFRLRYRVWQDNTFSTLLTDAYFYDDPGGILTPGQSRNQDINVTIPYNFAPGNLVEFLFWPDISAFPTLIDYRVTEDGEMTVEGIFRMPETTTRAMRFYDVFKEWVKMMTNYSANGFSVYLSSLARVFDNCANNTWVTSGEALRGLPDPKLKLTFDDIQKTAMGVWCLGIGAEGNVLRMEKLPYFMQASNMLYEFESCGEVEVQVAKEFIYNEVIVGYPEIDYGELNGRQEINSEVRYSTGIKRVINKLDLTSPMRADVHGMEYERSKRFVSVKGRASARFSSPNTDSAQDNRSFLIECNENTNADGEYFPYRDPNWNLSDTIAGTSYYNIGLRPVLNLSRNLGYIRSFLPPGRTITFNTGKKNVKSKATWIYNNVLQIFQLAENMNILPTWNVQDGIYFRPYIFIFDAQPPKNLMQIMTTNPNRFIRFPKGDKKMDGFILDVGMTPGTNDTYNVRLLCSPNVNLSDLTHQ
jgi:hypothetical protein